MSRDRTSWTEVTSSQDSALMFELLKPSNVNKQTENNAKTLLNNGMHCLNIANAHFPNASPVRQQV